jgi:hypothetical protein
MAYLVTGVVLGGIWAARARRHRSKEDALRDLLATIEAQLDPNPTLLRRVGRWLEYEGLPALLSILLWPVRLFNLLKARLTKPNPESKRLRTLFDDYPAFELKTQDLVERLTVEQIEQRELVDDPLHAVPPVPFGFLHESWQALRAQLQPGDELWSFDARRTVTWYGVNYGERRTGYAIVRNGQPVASMLTMDRREKAPPPP